MAGGTAPVDQTTPRRRHFLASGLALFALDLKLANAQAVLAVRVWPARDYTRVTLELDSPLKYTQSFVENPPRLVVDLDGIDVDSTLRDLVAKVQPDDPYIRTVRVGQYQPRLMRLVFDLKTPVAPQLFTLQPIAQYKHRLVIDLFPARPIDPLLELLNEANARGERGARPGTPIATGPLSPSAAGGATGGGNGPAVGGAAPASSGTPASPGKSSANTGDPVQDLIRRREQPVIEAGNFDPYGDTIRALRTARPGASATSSAAPSAAADARGTPSAPGAPPSPASASQVKAADNRLAAARGRKPIVDRLVTIAIDPGHGGEDPGAIGQAGTREKDVVLAIGKLLRERIAQETNMRAYMTRDADFFVPLHVRVAKARRIKADLFISLHADAWVKPNARGASVFVLSERRASSHAARLLAMQENRADLVGGMNLRHRDRDVRRMLAEMNTAALIKDSNLLARSVLTELEDVGQLHKDDVEEASFAVLRAPDIPSILVETAFISNPQEEKRLANPKYQQQVAEAVFRGIRRYFVKNPPAGSKRPQA